jgi:hypothetical protein
MALSMNFTDSYGVVFPSSYWRLVQWNFSKDGTGALTFYGFSDVTQKGNRVIGQKQYSIAAADFATYFTAVAIDPLNINPQCQGYAFALAKQDVVVTPAVGESPAVMASFFASATSV